MVLKHNRFLLSVRLVDGAAASEGRVEVKYDSNWGSICDNGFGINEATVLCKMLGYEVAVTEKSFPKSSHSAWLKDLSCKGSENTIENCTHSNFGSQTCSNNRIAGVICRPNGK